jgi:hypothetical protein
MTSDAISAILRQLRVLWRAESLIAEIRLRSILRRTGFMAFAGLIAVFGLAALDFAAFFALAPLWGNFWATLAVAIGDFFVAVMIIVVGGRGSRDPELALATELRDQAIETVEVDVKLAVDEMTGFVRGPAAFAGSLSSLLRLITAILTARGKRG